MDSIATTRIDLQKLQLLNDRICQCLDALNQVRLSAHASTFAPTPYGYGYNHFAGQPAFGSPVWNSGFQPGFQPGFNTPWF